MTAAGEKGKKKDYPGGDGSSSSSPQTAENKKSPAMHQGASSENNTGRVGGVSVPQSRKELWLVTTPTATTDPSVSTATPSTDTGADEMTQNITTSKKNSSLEELKEAISWLESSESDPTKTMAHADHHRASNLDDTNIFSPTHSNSHTDNTAVSNRFFLDEVKRFELFRSVIQHEDDLLNQRVSWIILAQSFLMAAFISASTDDQNYPLKVITAGVGLLTVIVTMPAILAAGRNIELQQKVYFAHIGSEDRCIELHGHGREFKSVTKGMRKDEHRIRLRDGHIFPNMAFRGGGAMPIIVTVVALAVVQVIGWILLLISLSIEW